MKPKEIILKSMWKKDFNLSWIYHIDPNLYFKHNAGDSNYHMFKGQ